MSFLFQNSFITSLIILMCHKSLFLSKVSLTFMPVLFPVS